MQFTVNLRLLSPGPHRTNPANAYKRAMVISTVVISWYFSSKLMVTTRRKLPDIFSFSLQSKSSLCIYIVQDIRTTHKVVYYGIDSAVSITKPMGYQGQRSVPFAVCQFYGQSETKEWPLVTL